MAVTRKLGRPEDPEDALAVVQRFQTYPVAVVSNAVITKGMRRSIDSRISFWDALIPDSMRVRMYW